MSIRVRRRANQTFFFLNCPTLTATHWRPRPLYPTHIGNLFALCFCAFPCFSFLPSNVFSLLMWNKILNKYSVNTNQVDLLRMFDHFKLFVKWHVWTQTFLINTKLCGENSVIWKHQFSSKRLISSMIQRLKISCYRFWAVISLLIFRSWQVWNNLVRFILLFDPIQFHLDVINQILWSCVVNRWGLICDWCGTASPIRHPSSLSPLSSLPLHVHA